MNTVYDGDGDGKAYLMRLLGVRVRRREPKANTVAISITNVDGLELCARECRIHNDCQQYIAIAVSFGNRSKPKQSGCRQGCWLYGTIAPPTRWPSAIQDQRELQKKKTCEKQG